MPDTTIIECASIAWENSHSPFTRGSHELARFTVPVGTTLIDLYTDSDWGACGVLITVRFYFASGAVWIAGNINAANDGSGTIHFTRDVSDIGVVSSVGFNVWLSRDVQDDAVSGEICGDFTGPDLIVCAYGTRVQSDTQRTLLIDTAMIDALLLLFPAGAWLVIGFDLLVGLAFVPGTLCSGNPPPFPSFNEGDFILNTSIPNPGSLDKFMQALMSLAWFQYCECIPASGGLPPPTTPPSPVIPDPPDGIPSPPPPVLCNNDDVCAILNDHSRQLRAINSQLAVIRSLLERLQQTHVPFSYRRGATHAGLTGSGTLPVSGILGVSVVITEQPGYLSATMAPVNSWFRFGEISVGTSEGWERRFLITHNPHLSFDIGPAATQLGYLFEPGVEATIVELVPGP
jgi:hypothetical protein